MTETPIFDEMAAEHPEVITAMTRERWSYAAALARADAAIAARQPKTARKRARKATASPRVSDAREDGA